MAKKQEGEETLGAVAVEEITPEPQTETPTAEEKYAQLQQELEQTKIKLEQTDKGLRTAHQTLTEKSKELQRQADLSSRIDEIQETQKILAGMLVERGQIEEIEPSKRIDYLKQFDEVAKRQAEQRKQAQLETQRREYDQKADAVFAEAKMVFSNDNESLEKVEDLLLSGRLDRAAARVARAKSPEENKVKESEEERINKEVERRLLGKMQEKGMLASDIGGAQGGSASYANIRDAWVADPGNQGKRSAYFRARREKGI